MDSFQDYTTFLGTKEKFKKAETNLLFQTKMDENEFSPEKAKEILSLIKSLTDLKAVFQI